MTEHEKETAFLRQIILFGDTQECRKLEERIALVRRDERCVQRAASLMAMSTALGAAGLAFGMILLDNFPYGEAQFVIKLICSLGLASLISLLAFLGLLVAYRRKLNRLREECRQLVTKLLESLVGKPRLTPLRSSQRGAGAGEVAQGPVDINGSPDRLDASRERVAPDAKMSPEANAYL